MRNRLIWMAWLPPLAMVMLRPGLLPRATSWSMTLMQQWGSVLMSVTPVATEGSADMWSLGYHRRCLHMAAQGPRHPKEGPRWSKRPVLSPRIMLLSEPGMLLGAMSGSMVLLQTGSELTSMSPVASRGPRSVLHSGPSPVAILVFDG